MGMKVSRQVRLGRNQMGRTMVTILNLPSALNKGIDSPVQRFGVNQSVVPRPIDRGTYTWPAKSKRREHFAFLGYPKDCGEVWG